MPGQKTRHDPSSIRNKIKRTQVKQKLAATKKADKRVRRDKRKADAAELGDKAPPKQVPKTLDNQRNPEMSMVATQDPEVGADENDDEFADYFLRGKAPKIMITTRPKPSGELFKFVGELMKLLPNSFYYERKEYHIKDICQWANNKKFTHLIVLAEKHKVCHGMVVSHLPVGPTAHFRVTNIKLHHDVANAGKSISAKPEVILNGFGTRLGHRVGRFLGSFYKHEPNFKGREVVTFHNQRDFIFVRHHRYVFDSSKQARLQELGPQFTLKMRWLQDGMFDTKFGHYEWFHRRKEQDKSRRTFHL